MFHFAFFKRKTLKRWLLLTTCQSQVDNAPKDLSMVHLDEIGISQQSKSLVSACPFAMDDGSFSSRAVSTAIKHAMKHAPLCQGKQEADAQRFWTRLQVRKRCNGGRTR